MARITDNKIIVGVNKKREYPVDNLLGPYLLDALHMNAKIEAELKRKGEK